MFRRIFLTALIAEVLGGFGISVVQQITTAPLIHRAEQYESRMPASADRLESPYGPAELVHEAPHTAAAGAEAAWMPADGIARALYTALADILTGVGFALILAACFALSGRPVDGRTGLLWGLAGFASVSLAPALGLPPEVPGSLSADLAARQIWWLGCAAATAAGLWMMVFRRGSLWALGGILLIVVPHAIGAPQPAHLGGPVPPELAARFVAASLVTGAVFWCALGWLSGTVWKRLGSPA